MASAAYTALLAQPNVQWKLLAEGQVRRALRGWTSEGSSAYSVPLSLYSHPSTIRADLGLYLGVDFVLEGITPLTARASVALVKANASSYFYDTATSKLYVRTSGGVNPDGLALVQALGTIRLATTPVNFSDQPPYDAQIDGASAPTIEASRPDLLRGISAYPSGNLTLVNADGFWDALCDTTPAAGWLWINNTIRLLLGGDDMVYSDYEPLATMQMSTPPKCGDMAATFQLRSISNAIKTSFPRHTLGDFYGPSITLGGGTPTPSASLPMWWGRVADAPLVFVSDNGLRNKWISGDMYFLSTVTYGAVSALERATGTRTALTDIAAGGTDYFVLGGGDRSIEIIKTWDPLLYDIVADVSQPAQTCGAVAQAILAACGIASTLIATATFAQADLDNPAPIGIWAGVRSGSDVLSSLRSGADLLDEDTRSTFCGVTLSNAGQWTAKVWDGSFDLSTTPVLTDADLLSCDPPQTVPVLSTGVKVQFGRKIYGDTWSETSSSRTAAPFEQNSSDTNTTTVQTCLANAADAGAHAQRLALIDSLPKSPLQIRVGPTLMNTAVGNKVRIRRSRGPSSTGTFDQVMEVESFSKRLGDLTVGALVGNQRGLGELVKRVAPDGTPNWAAASADQRRQCAFLADDTTGMVDTSDRTTFKQAVIW
ncbi:MAG: hypothetical protein ABI634_13990 [Acidobacteriota bacterium]